MRAPPSKKPIPQALDLIEAGPRVKTTKDIVALRPLAKRFVFDFEASSYLGEFIRDCGDLIVANRQFAIPPFETVYIQCELDRTIEKIGARTSAEKFGKDDHRDAQVGYLIHKRRIYTLMRSVDGKVAPGVFVYDRDTSMGVGPIFEEPVALGDKDDEWARLGLLLGTTGEQIPDEDTRLDIIRSHRIALGDERWRQISRMQRREQILGAAGDIRNIWAMLLLINQKHGGVSFADVPWQAALVKGKRRVFAAHSVVSIHLKPKQSIRSLMRPHLHAPRAAHDVKGHFAHWRLRDGCAHEWPPLPDVNEDGIPRWHCARCNGLRVWRKDYRTGDATAGFTTTEYRVTK